jgi:hypothetical protein
MMIYEVIDEVVERNVEVEEDVDVRVDDDDDVLK